MGKSVQDVNSSGDTLDQASQTGSLPTEDTSLQTDQSNQEDVLFGVNDVDQLPDELRPIYNDWQGKYTQKRQEERGHITQLEADREQLQQDVAINAQKAADYDELSSNPAFQDFALSEAARIRGQQTQQPQQDNFNYERFEDGDELRSYKEEILTGVRSVLKEALQPIMGNVAANAQKAEFDGLVATANQNSWPDPNSYAREMDIIGRKHPNMSMSERYDMAVGMRSRSVVTRPPVNTNVNNQPSSTPGTPTGQGVGTDSPLVKPGGTSVNQNPLAGKTALEQILEESNSSSSSDGTSKRGIVKVITDLPKMIMDIAREQKVDVRDM